MVACHLLHQRHQQHVMVDSQVTLLENRSQLKLVGSYLIMARLDRDGQFKSLYFQVLHKSLHTVGDGTEIVVVHLLVLGTLVAHQRATRHQQVGTGRVKPLVHQEVLLFPTQVHLYLRHVVVEVLAHILGSLAYSMQRTEQGSLVVQSLARICNEDGGNTQRVVNDEYWRCRVPGRIAAGLEGVSYAAVGEAGGVRFLLHEQFSAELLNHAPFAVVLYKGIVLLGSTLGQRLEPVGIVRAAHLLSPLLHAGSHRVSYRTVQRRTVIHHVNHLVVDVLWQVLIHLLAVEHVFAKEFRRALPGHLHLDGPFLKRFFYYLKSQIVCH